MLQLDYANCLGGITEPDPAKLSALTEQLNSTAGTGWERWRKLPFDPMRSEHVEAVRRVVGELPEVDNLVVLGIGGSALGNVALHAALTPPTWNLTSRPRLFVLDNIDPGLVGPVLDVIDLKSTVVNVISKSGETAETAAQFMIVRSLMKDSWPRRVVAITDPEKGTMRSICDAEGIVSLPVPEGVGGRFSVLSPVGLFSAAMCGIDIDGLLDGAAAMDERCSQSGNDNPAAILAWLLIEHARRGRHNHVLMPYANSLYPLADWFRQLWAESLGKDGHGPTPIKALGATDQHSQIQLYRDGPDDKVIGFVALGKYAKDVPIPSDLDVEPLKYLQGSTLGTLLDAERRATEFALVESKRPNFTITLPELNAEAVGQFIQLWEIATAYAGLMLGINAYDQPAVETGKVATVRIMESGRT